MAAIMDTLREDHRHMTRMLDKLEAEIAPLRGEAVPNFDVINEVATYCLTYPNLYHHPMEDRVYRRLIDKGVSPSQVGDLETAHEDLAGMTRRLAQIVKSGQGADPERRNTLASLVESFVSAYRLHMEAEDKIFFPLAEEKLAPEDWAAIESEMSRLPDPMFSDRGPIDYPRLHQAMVNER